MLVPVHALETVRFPVPGSQQQVAGGILKHRGYCGLGQEKETLVPASERWRGSGDAHCRVRSCGIADESVYVAVLRGVE
jgi:hypothetical protein